MPNPENLTPYPKGVSGNPAGKPKGTQHSKTRLLRLLDLVQKKRNPITGEEEEFTVLELMDMQMISKALRGDQRAYEAVVDRLEGKPKQTTDITADIKGNVQITIEPDADCQPIKD
jgi:hypothetical protein